MIDGNDKNKKNKIQAAGKLSPEALTRSVFAHVGRRRPEVLIGPAVGEDAAVIRWTEGKLLVFASDPIVGADRGAGTLLVRVNVNDIASKGGEPAYIAVTLILPPAMGERAVSEIMSEIHEECDRSNIAIVGGHTEFNDRYTHPVLNAALIGMADRPFAASDIRAGDAVFVTKHIGIEGMAILASDRPDLFAGILTAAQIREIANWMESTSVLPESRLLRQEAVFMHDPTEGGFYGGLAEICRLAGLEADIDREAVPIHPYTRKAAEALGFEPLSLVASGSMLAVVPREREKYLFELFEQVPIDVRKVGVMSDRPYSIDGREVREELWGLLAREKGSP